MLGLDGSDLFSHGSCLRYVFFFGSKGVRAWGLRAFRFWGSRFLGCFAFFGLGFRVFLGVGSKKKAQAFSGRPSCKGAWRIRNAGK